VRFLDGMSPVRPHYDDIFVVPGRSTVESRFDVDLATSDGTGATIPIVVANMTAVAAADAETVARRGGLVCCRRTWPGRGRRDHRLVRPAHGLGHPAGAAAGDAVADAVNLLPKRPTGRGRGGRRRRPLGVVDEAACHGVDRFTRVGEVPTRTW